MKRTIVASLLALGCSLSTLAAPITYNVNRAIGAGSVVGSIETDGTLGVLTGVNILDWSLTLTSANLAGGSSDLITQAGGGFTTVLGTALSATLTDLIFDFGAASNSGFVMQGFDANAWCMVTAPLSCLGEAAPSDGIYFSAGGGAAELAHPGAAEVIGSAIPEPATVALFGLGIAGLTATRKRRQ